MSEYIPIITFMLLLVFLIISGVVCHITMTDKKDVPENFTNYTSINPKILDHKVSKSEKLNSLYSPFITRPEDLYAHSYSGRCRDPLYPKTPSPFGKGELTGPCCPDVGGRYYGQRPILTPQTLNDMIREIFRHITQKVPKRVDQKSLKYQNQFCNTDSYTNIMKYVLNKINMAQAELKIFRDYAKADTWGGDQFAYLNEQVFMFTEQNPNKYSEQEQARRAQKKISRGMDTKYVLTFTLYLPLRSLSLDTTAIVIEHQNKYYLKYIDFTTKEADISQDPSRPKNTNIAGFKSGEVFLPDGNSDLPPEQNTPNWIYGNSIENKTFNLKGFHDPDESKNILIPGGVPEEYDSVLTKCDQSDLMLPAGSTGKRFKGGYQNNSNKFVAPVYPDFPNKSEVWNVRV